MQSIFTITRPLKDVPKSVRLLLLIAFLLQCLWHFYFSNLQITKQEMPYPQQSDVYRLISLGDSISAARFVMLWAQAFDNQPGLSLSLKELDYAKVVEWLNLVLDLDSKTQYPLLAAARFYAEVQEPAKQRQMIVFIKAAFLKDPDRRWRAMAHAVYIAKHRIKDMSLAVECARLLRLHATGKNVPYWAKQMEFFVLEDMGELGAAKILISGLLESGELDDKHQQQFLRSRLKDIEQRQSMNSTIEQLSIP